MGFIRQISFFRLIVFAVSMFIASNSMAQSDLLLSTIDTATRLRDVGNFEQAAEVLHKFNTKYPGNIWVARLYAETLFWLKKYDKAALVYEETIRTNPNDFDVKYEYAIMLFDRGKYRQAKELLVVYTNKNQNVAGAESLLGITNYYHGDFKEAAEHLEKSLALNPNNNRTKEIFKEVSHIVKPWIMADIFYTDDSQPLKQLAPALEGGWYHSPIVNLSFSLNLQNFFTDDISSNLVNFQLQNNFHFQKAGLRAKVSAGTFFASTDKSVDFLWGILFQQKLTKYLSLTAGAERSAYTYTLASIKNPFLRNKYNFSLAYEKPKSWNASTGYIAEYFPDTNNVQSFHAWVMSPSITFSIFELSFGYAFNYANSKESRFVPEQSLEEILDDFQADEKIQGVYDPYFTPNDQFGNSVLSNFYIIPSQKINIKLHASVGFYARAMNPYFYLDSNNAGKTVIRQGFYQEAYTPLDLGINFNADLSDNMILNFSYNHLQTFYFNSNNFQLGLKIYF